MAKQTASAAVRPGVVARATEFLREVKTEMVKVAWPSMEEVKSSTTVVLFLVAIIATIIYLYDMVFLFVLGQLLRFG